MIAHIEEERKLRVFENRVLRIFGPKRDEVTEEWRKLHSEELNDLYSSPNIVGAIKSRGMRRAVLVACMGVRRGVYRVLLANLRERDHLGDPGVLVYGRVILRWFFRKWVIVVWTGSIWLRLGTGGRILVNAVMNLRVP